MRLAAKGVHPVQDAIQRTICPLGATARLAAGRSPSKVTKGRRSAGLSDTRLQYIRRPYSASASRQSAAIGFFASAQARGTEAAPAGGALSASSYTADHADLSPPRRREQYDLFHDVRSLLLEPQHTLSTLLDAAHPSALDGTCIWPEKLLLEALKRQSDPHSLMRLFPSVEVYATQHRNRLPRVGKVLRLYLKAIRQCRALAAVREVVQIWMDVVETVQEEGGMDGKRWAQVKRVTWELASVLRSLANPVAYHSTGAGQITAVSMKERGKAVPDSIKQEVEALVRMICRIVDAREAQVGSTSRDAGNHIDPDLRRIAFSSLVLTPSLRQLLLARVPEHSITTGEWHACMLSAARQGEGALADHFRAMKAERLARASEWARKGELREDVEGGYDDDALDSRARWGGQVDGSASETSPGGSDRGFRNEFEKRHVAPEGMTAIDDIIQAHGRGSAGTAALMAAIEPHLSLSSEQDLQDTGSAITPYAWSILATHTAKHAHVGPDDLLVMIRDMPRHAISPYAIAPIMDGLLARGQAKQAWELWEEMSSLHLQNVQTDSAAEDDTGDAPSAYMGVTRPYIDQALLSSATYACAKYRSLDAAVELVDSWAARVRPNTGPTDPRHGIQLDTQNLNVLLHLCSRHHRPHLAFRLFAAALPRWGVWPDTISLNLVLDCARFAPYEADSVSARLKALAQSFRFRGGRGKGVVEDGWEGAGYEVYDSAGFAAGPTSVLLDPVDADGVPNPESEFKDGLKWYERGRHLLRSVILGNNPHLSATTSPLDFNSLFDSLDDILARHHIAHPNGKAGGAKTRPRDRAPRSDARYTHIMPDATTFQVYVTLLGYYNMPEEIPTALAWAREMDVQPTWRCMCSALAFVCETEGPRRRVKGWYDVPSASVQEGEDAIADMGCGGQDGREGLSSKGLSEPGKGKAGEVKKRARLVRDEEVLRRWLQDWVKGDVPTEADVAAFINRVRSKGGRMAA